LRKNGGFKLAALPPTTSILENRELKIIFQIRAKGVRSGEFDRGVTWGHVIAYVTS
jgi:hypothetical protein